MEKEFVQCASMPLSMVSKQGLEVWDEMDFRKSAYTSFRCRPFGLHVKIEIKNLETKSSGN